MLVISKKGEWALNQNSLIAEILSLLLSDCNNFVGVLCILGLQILFTLLQNVAQEEAAAQSFYQTYFCDILQHIFSVVTDTSHTAGENLKP